MRSPNLADVVIEVKRSVRILVWEAIVIRDCSKGLVGYSAKVDVDELTRRVWERRLERQPDSCKRCRFGVLWIQRQVVLAGAEDELVGQRRRQHRQYVQGTVPGRTLLEYGRRQREILARSPPEPIRQNLLIGILGVTGESVSIVGDVIVYPHSLFPSRITRALLRLVIEERQRSAAILELIEQFQDRLPARIDHVRWDVIIGERLSSERVLDNNRVPIAGFRGAEVCGKLGGCRHSYLPWRRRH